MPIIFYNGYLKVHTEAAQWLFLFVLHIPLAETMKEMDNLILKGVDLYDHTKVFLWRRLNYYKPVYKT